MSKFTKGVFARSIQQVYRRNLTHANGKTRKIPTYIHVYKTWTREIFTQTNAGKGSDENSVKFLYGIGMRGKRRVSTR